MGTQGLLEGRLRGSEGLCNSRALVREMYERYTSVYERSGKKILRGATRAERWSKVRTGTVFGAGAQGRRGFRKGGCGARRGCQHTSARTRDVRALHEHLREIGQKNFARREREDGWSNVRTGTVVGVGTQGLLEGRLRGSKGLPTHERSYERCTSVIRAFTRDRAKNFRGRTGVERWSEVRTGTVFGVGAERLPKGRLRGSKMLPTHERSYKRCTSVTRAFTRDRTEKFARRDRRAEAGRGAWLWGSMKRQRKGIQSKGLRSGCRARGAGDGWRGRSGARGRWKAWLPVRPKEILIYIIYYSNSGGGRLSSTLSA